MNRVNACWFAFVTVLTTVSVLPRAARCEDAHTPLANLKALLAPDVDGNAAKDRRAPYGSPRRVRSDRATRLLETAGQDTDARDAACWMIEKYGAELANDDFYTPTGAAIVLLAEASEAAGLRPQERDVLKKIAGDNDTVAALSRLLLLKDELRGQKEPARLQAYQALLDSDSANVRSAFLTLHWCHVPPALQHYWEAGSRYAKTHKPSYSGHAREFYDAFRKKQFQSVNEEMDFLWSRITEHYQRRVKEPRLPDGYEEMRYEEASAAAIRLIEIGDPVVPFLLAQRNSIVQAGNPLDVRARNGRVFEIEIMRGLARPEFIPLLKELAASPVREIRLSAEGAIGYCERGDPYPARAFGLFHLLPPVRE